MSATDVHEDGGRISSAPLAERLASDADVLVSRYPVARSALLPLLYLCIADQGYLTHEGMRFCAQRLGLSSAEVGAVATFYSMFVREPVGDWLIWVCTNPTCQAAGGQQIHNRFASKVASLGGAQGCGVTVSEAECAGMCDAAPVVQVNWEMYGPMTDAAADKLLDSCVNGQPTVSSWSGEAPRNFKETCRELAGINDAHADKLSSAARRQIADYDIVPSYKTAETDLPVLFPGADPQGHGGEIFAQEFGDDPMAAAAHGGGS